jgi:Protein phosphatase 2C
MAANWSLRWRSFTLVKDGNAPEEYEDALAGNPRSGRFAVADGASESSFAGLWAKLLVEGFVASGGRRTTVDWITPLQERWAQQVDPLALDWFGEDKRLAGAYATFLGLSFKKPTDGSREGRWKALAVGDACIFQVRESSLLTAFPVSAAADFGNRPSLLCSRSGVSEQAQRWSRAQEKIDKWQPGDRFLLMTDALAQWFLRRAEAHGKPWDPLLQRLIDLDPAAALTAYIKDLRRTDGLVNDDVTLLTIEF